MIDYEILIERCKRYDTKDEIVQCLDKAYTEHQAARAERIKHDNTVGAWVAGSVLAFFLGFVLVMAWWHRGNME